MRQANITIASRARIAVAVTNCHTCMSSAWAMVNSSSALLLETDARRLMLARRSMPALKAQRKQKKAMVESCMRLKVMYPRRANNMSKTKPQKSP